MLTQKFKGKKVVIAASGPSLPSLLTLPLHVNFESPIVAVNTSFRLLPNADVLYAGDLQWWKFHYDEIGRRGFKGELWTVDHAATRYPGVQRIKSAHAPGLGLTKIHTNGNSGFSAINLAYLMGARIVLLIGFDMKLGPEGQKHWHADYPTGMVQGQQFGDWIHKGATLAKDAERNGLEIINCTPGSALSCFPMSTLEQELA